MLKLNGLAKVETVTTKETLTSLKINTSKLNEVEGQSGSYRGFAACFNDAHEKAVDLNEGDLIKILDFSVTTKSSGGKYYTNVNIYDMEIIPSSDVETEPEDLPFS